MNSQSLRIEDSDLAPGFVPSGAKKQFGGSKHSVLVFNHLPKAAGTTMLKVLERYFGENYKHVASVRHWIDVSEFIQRGRRTGSNCALAGHFIWGIHELIGSKSDAYYFTMLRHPIDRFFSLYHYQKKRFQNPGDLSQFIGQFRHNQMVARLGMGSLELAKRRLESDYFCYGIVERFQESFDLLSKLLSLEEMSYTIRNKSDWRNHDVDTGLRERLEFLNFQDIALYNWALDRFDQRLGGQPVRRLSDPHEKIALQRVTDDKTVVKTDTKLVDLLASKKVDDAEAWINDNHPSPPLDMMRGLIKAYHRLGRFPEAATWLKRFDYPRGDDLNLFRSVFREVDLSVLAGQCKSWIADFGDLKCATADSPLNVHLQRLLLTLAECCQAVGNEDEVLQLLENAWQLNRVSCEVSAKLAMHLAGTRQSERGRYVLEEAFTRLTHDSIYRESFLVLLASYYLCVDSREQARRTLDVLMRMKNHAILGQTEQVAKSTVWADHLVPVDDWKARTKNRILVVSEGTSLLLDSFVCLLKDLAPQHRVAVLAPKLDHCLLSGGQFQLCAYRGPLDMTANRVRSLNICTKRQPFETVVFLCDDYQSGFHRAPEPSRGALCAAMELYGDEIFLCSIGHLSREGAVRHLTRMFY